jgi:hypothetical protein
MSLVEACTHGTQKGSFILNPHHALEESADAAKNAPFISPESSQSSLMYSAKFTDPEVLEPVLETLPFFLAHLHTKKERERARITWRWIGMLVSTCTAMHNALIQFVLGTLDAACSVGDARAVSLIIKQTWSNETGVHEAGVGALLTMMSAAIPNTKQFIACAAAQSNSIARSNGTSNIDPSGAAEEESLRLACWEHGALAVI